jgi:hypothetical protein
LKIEIINGDTGKKISTYHTLLPEMTANFLIIKGTEKNWLLVVNFTNVLQAVFPKESYCFCPCSLRLYLHDARKLAEKLL